MNLTEQLRIERETHGPEWEIVAYPPNSIGEALGTMSMLRVLEQDKKIQRKLRLVRITHEILSE